MKIEFLSKVENRIAPVRIGRLQDFLEELEGYFFLEAIEDEAPYATGIDLNQCLVKMVGSKGKLMPVPEAPSIEVTDVLTGHVYFHEYFTDGTPGLLTHRENGPAFVIDNGLFRREEYHIEGGRHRIGGPAVLFIDKSDGFALDQIWCENDEEHRLEGPSSLRHTIDTRELYSENYKHYGKEVVPSIASKFPTLET